MNRTRLMHRRGDATMKIIGTLVVVAVVGGLVGLKLVGPSSASGGWHEELDAGIEAAERTHRPLLVLYTAGWCPPCKRLKRQVLHDSEVADYLERSFVLVEVDLTNTRGPNNEVAAINGPTHGSRPDTRGGGVFEVHAPVALVHEPLAFTPTGLLAVIQRRSVNGVEVVPVEGSTAVVAGRRRINNLHLLNIRQTGIVEVDQPDAVRRVGGTVRSWFETEPRGTQSPSYQPNTSAVSSG